MTAPSTAGPDDGSAHDDPPATSRAGVAMGVVAYAWWGLTALYWPLTEPVGAIEVLAWRIVWSLVSLLVVLAFLRRWAWIRPFAAQPGQVARIGLAAVLVSANWGLFIWATSNDRVLDASLGYFINPLVSVALGVVVLGERLTGSQRAAIAIAAAGVIWLSALTGSVPWVGLVLAATFGLYGLLKKTSILGGLEGLTAETALVTPLAVVGLAVLAWRGDLVVGTAGTATTLAVVGAGVVTVVPLLAFAGAARRIPLATVGVLQYLAPSLMFVIGAVITREEVSPARLTGFVIVWIACALFVVGPRIRRRHVPPPV